MPKSLTGRRRHEPLSPLLAVLVLLSLLLLLRAHMDVRPTELRELLLAPGGPPGPGGRLLGACLRATGGPHGAPGWAMALPPLLCLLCFLPWADRVAGRGPGTPLLLLALGMATRPAWLHGTAATGSLVAVPMLLALVPRRTRPGTAACLAALLAPPLAFGLGPDHHLTTLVLAALVLADPRRGRGLLPGLALGLALLLVPGSFPPLAMVQTLPGWTPALASRVPGVAALALLLPLGWALALAPVCRASRRERAVFTVLLPHALLFEGTLPLLAFLVLPPAARSLVRQLGRGRHPGRRHAPAVAALVGALLLLPGRETLAPEALGRGLHPVPRLPLPIRLALGHSGLRAPELLLCPPPMRAEAQRLAPGARLWPPLAPGGADPGRHWRQALREAAAAESALAACTPAAALVPQGSALEAQLSGRAGWSRVVRDRGWSLFVGPRNLLP